MSTFYIDQLKEITKFEDIKAKCAEHKDKEQLFNLLDTYGEYMRLGSFWRIESDNVLRKHIFPDKTDYITTIFRITRKGKRVLGKSSGGIQYNAIYACLFSYYDKEAVHDYVIVGPALVSQDGEYRNCFMKVTQLIDIYRKYSKYLDEVETNIINQGKSGEIVLGADVHSKKGYPHKNRILESVDEMRLPIIFYLVAWINFVKAASKKLTDNHIVKGYRDAMIRSEDIDIYARIKKTMDKKEYVNLVYKCSRYYKSPHQVVSKISIGAKMSPLRIADVLDTNTLAWREYNISMYINDLVTNYITPGLSITGPWFIIRGKNIYSNPSMINKLAISKEVANLVKGFRTYTANTPHTGKEKIDVKIEGMEKAIQVPIEYAERELILSGYNLVILNEYVGHTLYDLPTRYTHHSRTKLKNGPIFSNFNIFSRYIFDIVYTIYCLNSLRGVMHNDLHLNNITVNGLHITKLDDINNRYVIYNVHELYLFPQTASHICIIDFSRAVTNSQAIKNLNSSDTGSTMYNYRKSISATYSDMFPDFYNEHRDKIESALLDRYDDFWKIYTTIDIYKACTSILQRFTMADSIPIGEDNTVWIKKIISISRNILTNSMHKFLYQGIVIDEWPALTIIKECFEHARLNSPEYTIGKLLSSDSKLIDIFNYGNIRYSPSGPDAPPIFGWQYYIDTDNKKELYNYKEWLEYQKYLKGYKSFEETKKEVARKDYDIEDEVEKIDFSKAKHTYDPKIGAYELVF